MYRSAIPNANADGSLFPLPPRTEHRSSGHHHGNHRTNTTVKEAVAVPTPQLSDDSQTQKATAFVRTDDVDVDVDDNETDPNVNNNTIIRVLTRGTEHHELHPRLTNSRLRVAGVGESHGSLATLPDTNAPRAAAATDQPGNDQNHLTDKIDDDDDDMDEQKDAHSSLASPNARASHRARSGRNCQAEEMEQSREGNPANRSVQPTRQKMELIGATKDANHNKTLESRIGCMAKQERRVREALPFQERIETNPTAVLSPPQVALHCTETEREATEQLETGTALSETRKPNDSDALEAMHKVVQHLQGGSKKDAYQKSIARYRMERLDQFKYNDMKSTEHNQSLSMAANGVAPYRTEIENISHEREEDAAVPQASDALKSLRPKSRSDQHVQASSKENEDQKSVERLYRVNHNGSQEASMEDAEDNLLLSLSTSGVAPYRTEIETNATNSAPSSSTRMHQRNHPQNKNGHSHHQEGQREGSSSHSSPLRPPSTNVFDSESPIAPGAVRMYPTLSERLRYEDGVESERTENQEVTPSPSLENQRQEILGFHFVNAEPVDPSDTPPLVIAQIASPLPPDENAGLNSSETKRRSMLYWIRQLGLALFVTALLPTVVFLVIQQARTGQRTDAPSQQDMTVRNETAGPTPAPVTDSPTSSSPPPPTLSPEPTLPVTAAPPSILPFLRDPETTTVIDISYSNVDGTMPTELGLLTRLVRLNLSTCGARGSIPTELGLLTQLEHLDLSSNDLTGSIPTELGMLSKLTHLDLQVNSLDGEVPSWIGKNSLLVLLNVQYNRFKSEIPSELGLLTKLSRLELVGSSREFDENLWIRSIPSELGHLTELSFLSLQGKDNCCLMGTIPVEFGLLTMLESLILSENAMEGSLPAQLGSLTLLTVMDLSDNYFSGTISAELSSLSLLQELRLDENDLTGRLPAELAALSSLQSLLLNSNQLSGSVPSSWCSAKSEFVRFRVDCPKLSCSCCTDALGESCA